MLILREYVTAFTREGALPGTLSWPIFECLLHLPCWQMAPWTMVTASKTDSISLSSCLNRLTIQFRNMISNVNPRNVKNIIVQTSKLNGMTHMLRTLDSGGCLNIVAGLRESSTCCMDRDNGQTGLYAYSGADLGRVGFERSADSQ